MSLVLALLLAACDGPASRRLADLPESARLGLWARHASYQQRVSDLADSPAAAAAARELDDYVAHLRDNLRFDDSELATLGAEAQAKGWRDGPSCRAPEQPIRQHGLVVAPLALARPPARYTAEAYAQGAEGVVITAVEVGPDGTAAAIEIVRGLPFGLDGEARAALATSRWAPALLCGRPVAVRYHVTVEFRLPCDVEAGPQGPA